MVKPFDVTKFRKSVTKNVKNISVGFHDPDTWISTGNYCLNYRISGDFNNGIPLGKVTVFAGESGSGKSFLASGNLVREAQRKGIYVVLVDSENALDEAWLQALGVDTSEDKLLKLNMAMIDEVALVINNFTDEYRATQMEKPLEDRMKVLFVIDSLGMLLTPTEVKQFEAGDMKGDMGRKAKQLKALIINCVNTFAELNIGLVATQHTYASQDMFSPDPVVAGGSGFVYASSIMIAMRKLNLKEDVDGNKSTTIHGIRAKVKVMKTRFTKPFENVELKIPYNTGMSPYSGLVTMFESIGMLTKTGNRLSYKPLDGSEPIVMFRKKLEANENGILDTMMKDQIVRDASYKDTSSEMKSQSLDVIE